jgi:hypothetical protein
MLVLMSTSSVHSRVPTAYAHTTAGITATTGTAAATATFNLQQGKAKSQSGVCIVILAVIMASYSRLVS